jgi:hypothetical protein
MITVSIALMGIMPVVQSTAINMSMAVFQNGFAGALSTTFTSCGADGFMVRTFSKLVRETYLHSFFFYAVTQLWRCAMLYEGISRGRRMKLIAVLAFMGLASLGMCRVVALYFWFPR